MRSGARSNERRVRPDPRAARSSLIEHFALACRMLRLPLEGPFVVATSGGADSAAALVLLREVSPHAAIIACYIDHGIRPRASIVRDISALRAQARAARARVVVRRVAVPEKAAGSREERARIARYKALAEVARKSGASVILTGQHQDDLVETSLLALVRGTGIDGVAAMRPLRRLADGVVVARPLLWATKAQCDELVRGLALPVSYDETNRDLTIRRNAVRALLAQLEGAVPGARRSIARSAALLADDKALLDRMSSRAWQRARSGGTHHLSTAALRRMPVALVRRVIRHAVAASGVGLRDFSYEHCDAIARAIASGRGGSYHAGKATVELTAGKLIVERKRAPSKSPFEPVSIDLAKLPQEIVTPLGRATFTRRSNSFNRSNRLQRLDFAALQAAGLLQIRPPRPRDKCIPSGRTRPVSLARFLAKSGVPKSKRGTVLLLCAGGRIAAVLGLRVMEPFGHKGSVSMLEVAWHPADD